MNSQIFFFIVLKLASSESKALNLLADEILKDCHKRYNTPSLREFNKYYNKLNKDES